MVGSGNGSAADEARANFDAGNFQRARELALAALAAQPDDAGLLRLAGKASLELGLDDAAELLERAAAFDPHDPELWRELADALVDRGRPDEASVALRRAVKLRPDDADLLVDFGHTVDTAGQTEEAIACLRQAAELQPGHVGALRGLAGIYRREGRLEDALESTAELTALNGEDVLAALDAAELSLELGRLDDAASAFRRLLDVDEDPEHAVYAYHGIIEAEIRRGWWRRALDVAVDATRVDRLGRTTDVLAFVVARVFGESGRPAPSPAEIDLALAQSRSEHRRLHTEALVL